MCSVGRGGGGGKNTFLPPSSCSSMEYCWWCWARLVGLVPRNRLAIEPRFTRTNDDAGSGPCDLVATDGDLARRMAILAPGGQKEALSRPWIVPTQRRRPGRRRKKEKRVMKDRGTRLTAVRSRTGGRGARGQARAPSVACERFPLRRLEDLRADLTPSASGGRCCVTRVGQTWTKNWESSEVLGTFSKRIGKPRVKPRPW